MYIFESVFLYFLGKYPVVQLLDHRVVLFLTFFFFLSDREIMRGGERGRGMEGGRERERERERENL